MFANLPEIWMSSIFRRGRSTHENACINCLHWILQISTEGKIIIMINVWLMRRYQPWRVLVSYCAGPLFMQLFKENQHWSISSRLLSRSIFRRGWKLGSKHSARSCWELSTTGWGMSLLRAGGRFTHTCWSFATTRKFSRHALLWDMTKRASQDIFRRGWVILPGWLQKSTPSGVN